MVRKIIALLVCMIPLASWAELKAQADKHELALGEALTFTISGPVNSLEAFDTTPLLQDFEIRTRSLSHGERDEVLTLTLHPLHTGVIVLPGMHAAAGKTRPISVHVLEESKGIPKVRLRTELEPANPLVRQPVRFTLEACDDGSLEWKRPVLPTLEGLQIRALGEEQTDVEREGAHCTAHRWHWALQPLSASETNLPLPMLEAGKFGQSLRYPPPLTAFQARPIPAWLPQETAIGQPVIKPAPLPHEWPLERPLAWRLDIEGAYGISDIKRLLAAQLAAYPVFSAYPPVVESVPQGNPDAPYTKLAVTLYAVPHTTNDLMLPELAFPYLDPATEHLQTIRLTTNAVRIVNPMVAKAARFFGGLLAAIVLTVAGWRLKKMLAWRLARRRCLRAIAATQTPEALAMALRQFSLQSNTPSAITLGLWHMRVQSEARLDDPAINRLLDALEQSCYGVAGFPFESMKRNALQALRNAKPQPGHNKRAQ
jgi:hypothetical protein